MRSAEGTATPFSHDEIVGGLTPNAELNAFWTTAFPKWSLRSWRSRSDREPDAIGDLLRLTSADSAKIK
jgi:hypothetical protein